MQQNSVSPLIQLSKFFKPHKREIVLATLALLVTALTILFLGKGIKYLIDYGFAHQDSWLFHFSLLGFVGAIIVMAIAGYYRSLLLNSIAEKIVCDLRKQVYSHIIKLSAEFFETTKVGDIVTRFTADINMISNLISSTVPFLLRNLVIIFGGIIFLFLTSLKLTLISLCLIPLAIAPIIALGYKIKNFSQAAQGATAMVGSCVEESINGVKTIQSYLSEEYEIKNFTKIANSSLDLSLKKIRLKAFLIALVIIFAFGTVAVILWVGGNDVLSKKLTSGELSSFIFYSILLATALSAISQIFGQIQSAFAATKRVFELMAIVPTVQENSNYQPFSKADAVKINFNHINFSYPSNKENNVLNDFNLEIKPGQNIAIVGTSGSGKSTILQLLLRFYDVNSGVITLNDVDIKSMSLADLRRNFSYISQDCFIFSGTVFENLIYANPQLSEDEINKIITSNSALSFINQLPDKIHSFVGEKGVKLSGGQRQRIAIARAIIKDSPILLLDEATSSLDNQNEQSIFRIIADLAQDKTVITIAHKLSTIISSDYIVFVKDGKIAEMGTHDELMKLDGFYKKMYEVEQINSPSLAEGVDREARLGS